jgi:serine/threonine protein kinase
MSAEGELLKKHGWKVHGPVGGGAAGAVFKVRKAEEGPLCAAKVLRNKDSRPEPRQRFVQEIEALRKLDHPAIIKVHEAECDEAEKSYFYIMEYIEGIRPLKDFIGSTRQVIKNPFFKEAERSLLVYLLLLEGLQACEKGGIVHRDLSLGNVLVSSDLAVTKIIDFGCCHLSEGQTITHTDMGVGTPGYRAPECCAHTSVQPSIRADLYSAGKILWSMVTDQNTFEREKPAFTDLALSKRLPESPMTWHLHHIFAKTIRNDPNDRYKNTADAIQHGKFILERIRAGYPPLEKLSENRLCPVCGIGQLHFAGYLLQNQLTDHESENKGAEDLDLKREIGTIPYPVLGNLGICRYCGFGCFWSNTIARRNMKRREKLE